MLNDKYRKLKEYNLRYKKEIVYVATRKNWYLDAVELCKIGKTSFDNSKRNYELPHDKIFNRIDCLNNTSLRSKEFYYINVAWIVENPAVSEKKLHDLFNVFRESPNREFFKLYPKVVWTYINETFKEGVDYIIPRGYNFRECFIGEY